LRRQPEPHSSRAVGFAWAQLLLDLVSLTALNLLTGGAGSPVRGFFVLHMVFASLLLRRGMAYAAAATAIGLLVAGLLATDQWPQDALGRVRFGTWVVLLLSTVWLTNTITRNLRAQHRRLLR